MQVIDLGLEVLDFLVELEDGLPNVLGIQLVVIGELRDHYVIGVKSTLYHLLALENLLLHNFELCLYASIRLGPSTSRMCSTPSRISMV